MNVAISVAPVILIHIKLMFHFYTPGNIRKLWFSDVFKGEFSDSKGIEMEHRFKLG